MSECLVFCKVFNLWFIFETKEKSGKWHEIKRKRALWEQMGCSLGQECEDKWFGAGLCHAAGPRTGLLVSVDPAWGPKFQLVQPGLLLYDGWLVLEQHLYQDVSREGLPIHNRMPASQGPRSPHLCLRFAKLFWPRPVLYQSCAAFLLLLVLFMGRPFKLVGFGERAWEQGLILGLDHP